VRSKESDKNTNTTNTPTTTRRQPYKRNHGIPPKNISNQEGEILLPFIEKKGGIIVKITQ